VRRDSSLEIARRFEAAPSRTYRVVVPEAAHDQFADGSLFGPSLTPLPGSADRVIGAATGVVAAFFDLSLRGRPAERLDGIDTATDLYINAYPLGDRPAIPPPQT